jgi:hypothetical protein
MVGIALAIWLRCEWGFVNPDFLPSFFALSSLPSLSATLKADCSCLRKACSSLYSLTFFTPKLYSFVPIFFGKPVLDYPPVFRC